MNFDPDEMKTPEPVEKSFTDDYVDETDPA